jgi:3-deoxy-D-manno-octulosonate 8-phosphate phosphatase (KDO 8-P phosphatase)
MGILDPQQIQALFKGTFLATPFAIQGKLFRIKAFMGINMLRFNNYLGTGVNPVTGVITGENNNSAFALAKREHFHAVYYGIKNKKEALSHLCNLHNIGPHEVAYFFDDVLDFSIAELCGLRIMVNRECNPLLVKLALEHNFVDYLTVADGSHNAIREAAELLIGLSGRYDDTMLHRVRFSEEYQEYLDERNKPGPLFYTIIASKITELSAQ